MNRFNLFNEFVENTSSRFSLPVRAGVTDNKRLSKLNSGMPNRYLMAFFVLKNRVASQATDNDSIALPHFTGVNRHILGQPQFEDIPSYGGVTLQNTKALRRICRAVAIETESEPRHPLPVLAVYRVVLTQKSIGGHTHA